MTDKEKISSALEGIQCADMNLDNLANMIPGLSNHPFFKIVKFQIKETENILEGKISEETP